MATFPVRHISVSIERDFDEVYGFLVQPENFPKWASGLGESLRQLEGMDWLVEPPAGATTVRFTEPNSFGILDHVVIPALGSPISNPMRVFRNGSGSEVLFTLIQHPGMSDAECVRDADWVARDLRALKAHLEQSRGA